MDRNLTSHSHRPFVLWLPVALILALSTSGCTLISEKIATHLATHDIENLENDFHVIEADLALFRRCLQQRAGSCSGEAATPLPHSSQAVRGELLSPVAPALGQGLANSLEPLASDHPAKIAYKVLRHPVVQQTAALHDHLRGHVSSSAPGLSVEQGRGSQGAPQSTIALKMHVAQVLHFHSRLASSIGTTAWEALDEHCRKLLASGSQKAALVADCRRATFIRGYLGAYLRQGEFVEVDVQLVGAINALQDGAARIEADIQQLQSEIAKLTSQIETAEKQTLDQLAQKAATVGQDVTRWITAIEARISHRGGPAADTILAALTGLGKSLSALAQEITTEADAGLAPRLQALFADLDRKLTQIDRQLKRLENEFRGDDARLVSDIDTALGKADRTLSNVFRVSNVGFVSRDSTFLARLPTLAVTLDPTARRLIEVEDLDNQQILTSHSQQSTLGVARDQSGVGTGASIGAEIVRTFLEAIFDAHEGLPAVAPADQPDAKPTGLTLGAYSLPLFQSPTGNVDSHDLSRMTAINDRVATQTRLIAGRILSGIGPFSLGNPSLEDLLVEILATTVRKATEKATWCWYACDLDADRRRLTSDLARTGRDTAKAGEQKIDEDVQKRADAFRTWADQKAEQVRLRLELAR